MAYDANIDSKSILCVTKNPENLQRYDRNLTRITNSKN